MAVEKLSQIAPAGSPPAMTDQFVAVTGGTTDNLYTITQIQSALSGGAVRTLLTANTNYYVSLTGSDSNDGKTPGTAWATLQHAAFFVSAALDFGGFVVTVNVGAGSFAGCGLATCVGGGGLQFVGAGVALTTITNGPNDGVFNFGESFSFAVNGYNYTLGGIDGLTIASTGTGIGIYSPTVAFVGFNLTTAPSLGIGLAAREGFGTFAPCTIFLGTTTVPSRVGNYNIIFFFTIYGQCQAFNPITFTGTPVMNTLLQLEEYSFFQDFGVSFSGAYTTVKASHVFEWFSNSNLDIAHFITGTPFVDPTSLVGQPFLYVQDLAGFIGAVGPKQWSYFKDGGQATGFGNFFAFNDSSTLAYVGKIGQFLVANLPVAPAGGTEAWVTDAAAPVFGAAVTGGGGVFSPVYYDAGTATWRSG